jgi:hypothetical protein
MSRFGIEGLVRRWSASLLPSSLCKRAWMVLPPKTSGGHPCPTNQPMSADSGRSLGERAAACGSPEAPGARGSTRPYTLIHVGTDAILYHFKGVSLAEIEAFWKPPK